MPSQKSIEQFAGFRTHLRPLGRRGFIPVEDGFRRTPKPGQVSDPFAGSSPVRRLTARDLDVVFQPIFDCASREVFAFEALVRCRWPSLRAPKRLLERAVAESSCGRLGRLIREVALARCPGASLFLNVHPAELMEPWLLSDDDPISTHDQKIFLEVTESEFGHRESSLAALRELEGRPGISIAVDDLGAGHSDLKRLLDLQPRIVKLDRSLVNGLDQSARQQLLVSSLVRLCTNMGARVVAEGVESHDELLAVGDTGAHFVQGFLLARPSCPPPRASWPIASSAE